MVVWGHVHIYGKSKNVKVYTTHVRWSFNRKNYKLNNDDYDDLFSYKKKKAELKIHTVFTVRL